MRIEFQYTADDLVEAARPPGPGGESDALRASRRAKGRRNAWRMLRREPDSAWSRADVWRVRGGLLMLLGLLLMILATGYLGIRSQPAWFILCGIVFVLTAMTYGLALWKATRPGIRRHFASSPANADRCVVDIDDAGVVFDWPAWSCAVDWAAIKHTIETPALFLVIDDTPNTFIIPKRAFASDADRERCGQMLRQHVQGDVQWPT